MVQSHRYISELGIQAIQRVEKGIYYTIHHGENSFLSMSELGDEAKLLHDPMTEGIYTDLSDFFDAST